MDETPRQKLAQMIALYGPAVVDDPRRCEALMRDLLGADQYRREVNLLVAALRERVPHDLLASVQTVPSSVLLARLAQRLHDNLGIREDYAHWAVAAWAQALGVGGSGETSGQGATGETEQTGRQGASVEPGKRERQGRQGAATTQPSQVTLVVAADGSGDYVRLADAVATAPPGAAISVRPGLYQESLTVDKRLEILGSGGPGDIIIHHPGPCLTVRADGVKLRGVGLARFDGGDGAAVAVERGQLSLEECQVTSKSRACIAVAGEHSVLNAWRCRVFDGAHTGVWVYDRAGGVLDECDINGHARNGVQISRGADPLLLNSRIQACQEVGLLVDQYGLGRVEGCDIRNNAFQGVMITDAGEPVLQRCRINNNEVGIWITRGGRGQVSQCDLRGNRQGAWKIGPDSRVQRYRNTE